MTQMTQPNRADVIIGTLMAPKGPADPYPYYEELREIAPNHVTPDGLRFVSTYDLCSELLRSKDFGQSFGFGAEGREDESAFIRMIRESLILLNPPEHTRLRRLVSLAFSARMIKDLEPKIQARIDGLMDNLAEQMRDGGVADIVTVMAEPLPALVIGEMLGAREEDQHRLREWEEAIADNAKPILDEELLRRGDWAVNALQDYIRELIAERLENPGEDLISVLTKIKSEGDTLTDSELVNVIFTIMAAGSQTTTATLCIAMNEILRDPAKRAKLAADPELVPVALDEIMRYESTAQNTFMRIALRPTVLGGEVIDEGECVVGLLASANRDPAAFPNPDEIVLDRPDAAKSFAWGSGMHSCLGRALGRAQVTQAVQSLLARFPDMEIAPQEVRWRRLFPVRQLEHVYVRTTS